MKRVLSCVIVMVLVLTTAFSAASANECPLGENCPSKAFKDIAAGSWYHEAVDSLLLSGLMQGVGEESFAPQAGMTRAMFAAVLYRAEEVGVLSLGSDFSDVSADAWYADAVAWAASQGLMVGVGDGKFAPDMLATREQMIAVYYRYVVNKEISFDEVGADLSDFKDGNAISSWAEDAMAWAVSVGLLQGDEQGCLNPKRAAKRSDAAVIISRYEEKEANLADTWDGSADTSWYNDTDTQFTLNTAEELAGLAELVDEGNTFAGKTITLAKNMDLYLMDENGNRVCFEPIGDASNADFSGTFDGNGKSIINLYQDCNSKHLALFGAVYEGTVKNLTLDGARIENNGTGYAGGIAAYTGASTFQNITLKNTVVVNYNHNTAGIAAWCSNNGTTTTFEGINIESSTTIGSWWGSPDTRVGGIVGAMNTGNYVVVKNSKIACRLDVYNDVMSNYHWYNYRMAGMVVGDVRDYHTVDGRTQANPARVTCENVEVIFGDWANYHYCESASYGKPSYAEEGEYKFHRVEAGLGYGGVDLSACDHAEDETCNLLLEFDCLFGARDGKGIYGISAFEGVTVYKN